MECLNLVLSDEMTRGLCINAEWDWLCFLICLTGFNHRPILYNAVIRKKSQEIIAVQYIQKPSFIKNFGFGEPTWLIVKSTSFLHFIGVVQGNNLCVRASLWRNANADLNISLMMTKSEELTGRRAKRRMVQNFCHKHGIQYGEAEALFNLLLKILI